MNTNTKIDQPDYGMPVHPVCNLFPLITGNEFLSLCGDIREQGLVQPVVVHDGQLVDGRNRLLACKDVGVQPRFVQWRSVYAGSMSLARWIRSVNAERRHLTIDQIVAVEVEIRGWEEQEAARQRQAEAGKHGSEGGRGNRKTPATNPSQGFPQPEQMVRLKRAPDVRARLAKETGASEHKVQQALNFQKAAPELLKQVAQGTTTLRAAEKQTKAKAPKAAPPAKSAPAAPKRSQRAQRIDRLARACLSLLESTKHFVRLIAWLGETSGDFDQAELLLANATNSIAAATPEIERKAIAADPLNASRLGIEEALSCR